MKDKTKQIIVGSVLILLVLLTSACGQGGRGNADSNGPSGAPDLPEDVEPLVLLAKFDLAMGEGMDIEKISTKSVEETTFSDASLGVPEPGVEYPQVTTPGFIIILEFGGVEYEYHASGERVVKAPKAD